MTNFEALHIKLHSLAIFRSLLTRRTILALDALLCVDTTDAAAAVDAYCTFAGALLRHGNDFAAYLLDFMINDENAYIREACRGGYANDTMSTTLAHEVNFLQSLSMLGAAEIQKEIAYNGYLPTWKNSQLDFAAAYAQRIADLPQRGYGIFARHNVFSLQNGTLLPLPQFDGARLADLAAYETEREKIIQNTHALLTGKPAGNILLTGNNTAEKDSTINAVAGEFAPYGLRVVKVSSNQPAALPAMLESLRENPLKFIIYLENIDFSQGNAALAYLRTALAACRRLRQKNMLIYADIDTACLLPYDVSGVPTQQRLLQVVPGMAALQKEFALRMNFSFTEKETYATLVAYLADSLHLPAGKAPLQALADAYAQQHGGYTLANAQSFVRQLQTDGQNSETNK